MTTTAALRFGMNVSCRNGGCGRLRRVVVDPNGRVVTHLVVEPRHRQGAGHLVPIDLLDIAAEAIELRCSIAELHALEESEETEFMSGLSGPWNYEQAQTLSPPDYGFGTSSLSAGGPLTRTYDRVPSGEVEAHRGEHVRATDGLIGRLQGLVIDLSDYRMTQLLLDKGHTWSQKTVAIPVDVVIGIDHGIELNLTKSQVRDLPMIVIPQYT